MNAVLRKEFRVPVSKQDLGTPQFDSPPMGPTVWLPHVWVRQPFLTESPTSCPIRIPELTQEILSRILFIISIIWEMIDLLTDSSEGP